MCVLGREVCGLICSLVLAENGGAPVCMFGVGGIVRTIPLHEH